MKAAKWFLILAMASACAVALRAEVKLAPLFTDNMVLQREMPVPVWGKAAPGEKIAVSFAGQIKDAVADKDGKWLVKLDPLKADRKPADLKVKGTNELTLKNVLVGEVWLCSGQSNMEMGIGGVNDAEKEIADAGRPLIRLFMVENRTSSEPQDELGKETWKVCSPKTVAEGGWRGFSAAGYFFGRELQESLDVPVGLIESDWGGTPAQAWTKLEFLADDPDFAHYMAQYKQDSSVSKETLAKYGKQRKEIEAEMAKRAQDPGNKGEADGWHKPGLDCSSWEKVSVPNGWFKDKVLYGAVWFRRDIEIPAAWAGKDLLLNLGIVDDFDIAYFNGEKVGATGKETKDWWTVHRQYKIPAKLVKAGRNTIAIRVFNDYLAGGFNSRAELMNIENPSAPEAALKIAGDWLRKTEIAVKSFPNLPKLRNSPAQLYNAMIAPLQPFAIRGAIWYQGESNAGRAFEYRKLFPTMIASWRASWGQGDFPFYFVQLANFRAVKEQPEESSWAELREAQSLTLGNSFNSGMAVIIDIGEAGDIHPKNKQDVGHRLALVALAKTYGEDAEYSGPVCESMKIEDGAIRLYFSHLGKDGLFSSPALKSSDGGPLKGFAICGPDRKFVWADAKIDGSGVVVSSPKVKDPIAVRYAWADNPVCNLVNAAGLPASPFRTDAFPISAQPGFSKK